MTRPVPPAESEVSQATVDALHALYRDASGAEPAPALDRAILDAARAEVRTGGASKQRTPWWKRWLPATAAVAVAVMGLSLTWRVMDEQERGLRGELSAVQAARQMEGKAPAADQARAAQPPRAAPRSSDAAAPRSPDAAAPALAKSRRSEPAAIKDEPARTPEPAASSAPAAPLPEESLKKSRRVEGDRMPERRDAGAAVETAAGAARQTGKLEAKSLDAVSTGDEAAGRLPPPVAQPAANLAPPPVVDAATPEAWLRHIRELHAAGRGAEAQQSLARFRQRYPEFALPDDLTKLREPAPRSR